MDAKEFEKRLIEGLKKQTPEDIKRIHDKFNAEGDYGVDKYGRSYRIPSTRKGNTDE